MLTKTSLLAIRALLYLAQSDPGTSVAPRRIAEALGESTSYLAKVLRLLVKVGVLRAERGVKGGVRLNKSPSEVTLLTVVEACQGTILGDYCASGCDFGQTCNFHKAAEELHRAVTGVLSCWTMARLAEKARPDGTSPHATRCVMVHGQ